MIIVISPAKTLYSNCPVQFKPFSQVDFLPEAEKIISVMKKKKPAQLANLMGISPKLAETNYQRFQAWATPFTPENSWQAILMFNGDVYQGLKADTFSADEFEIAQQHLRILSGVYGLLKPLDLIQPYRLEMGTSVAIGRKKNLYDFWKARITAKLNQDFSETGGKVLINLASNEYFSAIDSKNLEARIITLTFKEQKSGQYQVVSFFAKRARGLMSRFIIQNQINDPEEIKAFDLEGYYFNNGLSKGDNWVFTR
ncbi:MAG: peroxide stress protein YaaA [Bacteroidota bacterium]|nr:peroxide stress protein YaaA [Odoribacter sp.]MDP3643563.1 peroxide stress protein YaaA [Bacteroidota bacterium]